MGMGDDGKVALNIFSFSPVYLKTLVTTSSSHSVKPPHPPTSWTLQLQVFILTIITIIFCQKTTPVSSKWNLAKHKQSFNRNLWSQAHFNWKYFCQIWFNFSFRHNREQETGAAEAVSVDTKIFMPDLVFILSNWDFRIKMFLFYNLTSFWVEIVNIKKLLKVSWQKPETKQIS